MTRKTLSKRIVVKAFEEQLFTIILIYNAIKLTMLDE